MKNLKKSFKRQSADGRLARVFCWLAFVLLAVSCKQELLYKEIYFDVSRPPIQLPPQPSIYLPVIMTNILVTGDYLSTTDEEPPVRLYFTDGSVADGYVDTVNGVVHIYDDMWNAEGEEGKFFHTLRLLAPNRNILLSRKFDMGDPVVLNIDAAGELQFRAAETGNPNDPDVGYIPIDTVGEFALIGRDATTLADKYLLKRDMDMLGAPTGGNILAPLAHNWKPIGGMSTGYFTPGTGFTGTFDGDGKEIRNLYIDRTAGSSYYIGLFGYIDGAKLKNIILESGSVQGFDSVGGIAGRSANNSEISDCSNAAEVTATILSAGGVVGYASDGSDITGCLNTGDVDATGYAGGIAGQSLSDLQITECSNSGRVTTAHNFAGGIVGYYNSGQSISACSNSGRVTTAASFAGGIVGFNNSGQSISACYNTGDVEAADYAGGIVGLSTLSTGIWTITACSNSGAITANTSYAGGIVSLVSGSSSLIACANSGAVRAATREAGGIVGLNNAGVFITACYNTGDVEAAKNAGGIVGRHEAGSTTTACYTTGRVTNGTNAGGVAGAYYGGAIIACYWLQLSGNVTASKGNVGDSTGITVFGDGSTPVSGSSWPSLSVDWASYTWTSSGDENTEPQYWKDAGAWDSGNEGLDSVFPKLYWQP